MDEKAGKGAALWKLVPFLSPWLRLLLFADVQPRILAPRNQLIKVIQNNRTRLDCPFFGSPIPTLRW